MYLSLWPSLTLCFACPHSLWKSSEFSGSGTSLHRCLLQHRIQIDATLRSKGMNRLCASSTLQQTCVPRQLCLATGWLWQKHQANAIPSSPSPTSMTDQAAACQVCAMCGSSNEVPLTHCLSIWGSDGVPSSWIHGQPQPPTGGIAASLIPFLVSFSVQLDTWNTNKL